MTREGTVREGDTKTIVLSPHPDDAALSVGGALIAGYFKPPLLLVSVFTRTPDRAVREEEDLNYAKSVGAQLVKLGFFDASLRNERHLNPLITMAFSPLVQRKQNIRFLSGIRYVLLLAIARADSQFHHLVALVEQALTKCPDSVVVSPLGLGYHPDHLIVANVAKRLQASGRKVIFYEDLPYAWRFTTDEVGVQARLLDRRLRPTMLDVTAVYAQKNENLEAYASQLEPFAFQRTEEHAGKLGRGRGKFERVWSLPRAVF